MNKRSKRPRGISFEVYDPWDNQWIVKVENLEKWDAAKAARGEYSRFIRQHPPLLKKIGRPDGKPIGLRTLRTRTHLIY